MKRNISTIVLSIISLIIFFFSSNSYSTVIPKDSTNNRVIIGIWEGTLKVSGIELRLVFHVKQQNNKNFIATMDSPDQGAEGIKVNKVTFRNDNIRFDVKIVGGYFYGKLISDSLKIVGTWHQSGMSIPLVLNKTKKVELAKRPQTPKGPFPYKSENVKFKNKKAGITLAGTLTIPDTGSSFPAVLLISGSGPQDRNETIFGHKPFLVIADYLTRRGIAVLRVDDRGVGGSTGNFAEATTKDFASDALAEVEYLKTRKEINPQKIGLIGHSEGGLIAPMVAVESPDIAFIVLMAAPGLTGEQILYKQSALIAKVNGATEKEISKELNLMKKLYSIVKKVKDNTAASKELHKIYESYYESPGGKKKKESNNYTQIINQQIKVLTSPWFRYFLTYNPVPTLEKVKCPVLALDGGKDLQVPPKEDLQIIKKSLEKGGNKNFEIKEFPNLNHLFQPAKTGSPLEYSKIEETISPSVLKTISNWILKIVKE